MPSVLVVDDSPIDRRLAVAILQKESDLTVDSAAHGAEALSRSEKQLPDVVVTDLQMPEMSGLDLVRTMRSRHPLVPVVLMTAHGSEDVAAQALEQGAASYVRKAKLSEDLASTVRGVLATARAGRRHERLLERMRRLRADFVLDGDPTLLYPLVDYLQEQIARLDLCDDIGRIRLGIALQESLNNAFFHGNLEITAAQMRGDPRASAALIERRLREAPYRDRKIHATAELSADVAKFVIRDEGAGFAHRARKDTRPNESGEEDAGRGLVLMRTFMDEVSFNEAGNEVTMIKRRDH